MMVTLTETRSKFTLHCCVLTEGYFSWYYTTSGPGSSVGTGTGYGLDGTGIESLWRARFSAPVQTGPGAHPASCTMGTGSFPGEKATGA